MKNDSQYYFIVTMIVMLSMFLVFGMGLFVAFNTIADLQIIQGKTLNLLGQLIEFDKQK